MILQHHKNQLLLYILLKLEHMNQSGKQTRVLPGGN